MNRKFGIGILIASFSLSTINLGSATETVEVAPIIVQPSYDLKDLNQQMIEQDRVNRDQELAIRGLVDDNQKLSSTASKQDATIDKVNDTMTKYRDYLLSRDRIRIMDNEKNPSKYADLIRLTEDVDDMKGVGEYLVLKRDTIAQKYKMLNDLKDEMVVLNEKLKQEESNKNFDKVSQLQEAKIQLLTQKLTEMDQRISHYDEIIAQKDEEIAQLKLNLDKIHEEDLQKDALIKQLKSEIVLLNERSKNTTSSAGNELGLAPIIVNPVDNDKDKIIKLQRDQLALKQEQIELLKSELDARSKSQSTTSSKEVVAAPIIVNPDEKDKDKIIKQQGIELSKKQEQLDLLKSELENRLTEENNLTLKDQTIIKGLQQQVASLKAQSDNLSDKDKIIKSQADQLIKASEQFKNQGAEYSDIKNQILALREKMKSQAADLKAKDDKISWLNKVISVAKDKANFYKLSAQQEQDSMQQVQAEVSKIKNDFSAHFKSYDEFQTALLSLKGQVTKLASQLAQKDQQVNSLKVDLATKTAQETDKDNQIIRMKDDIRAILQDRANKEIYLHNQSVQLDNRVKLAKQLIDLQNQENSLLEERNKLVVLQNSHFENRASDLEYKIKSVLLKHQLQTVDVKNHMEELKYDLKQRELEISSLKTDLQNAKISADKNQNVLIDQIQYLKTQLQNKQDQIAALKSEIQAGAVSQKAVFDNHAMVVDSKIEELKSTLNQKEEDSAKLNKELEAKIAQEKNQTVLDVQIQDLKSQLQDKESQLKAMRAKLQVSREAQAQVDILKQQLADQQNQVDSLKQEIDAKGSQSEVISDYQKKLEDKNTAYNNELKDLLIAKNLQVKAEQQVEFLNLQLEKREAKIVKIKKDMYDLQTQAASKETNAQANDLNLSMMQQKAMDQKINEYQEKVNTMKVTNDAQAKELESLKAELALARQKLAAVPSVDELDFLKAALKQATDELKQKNSDFLQSKANAAEYNKEFQKQTKDFESLTEQLLDAKQEIDRKNEDLKYKGLEIMRLKDRARISENALKAQVKDLTQKLATTQKEFLGKTEIGKVKALETELKSANQKIQELESQLKAVGSNEKKDAVYEKLNQAVEKVDEQGRVIELLVEKLHEAGQSVNLKHILENQ